MSKELKFDIQGLLSQQLLKQSQQTTSPIAAAIGSFMGARGVRQAEQRSQKRLDEQSLENTLLKTKLAQSILGQNADPNDVNALALTSQSNLEKALARKFEQKDPVALAAGSALVDPDTGRVIGTTPVRKKEVAQTRKFNAEAARIEKELKTGAIPKDQFQNTQKLRKEFTTLSKDYIKQRDAFGRVQASASDPSPAGDLALIFNFMKVLDPNSVVRESEFATAANSAGVPERIRAQFNKVLSGEKLSVKTRRDFVTRAEKLFGKADKQHGKRVDTFTNIARLSGLPVDQVAIDLRSASDEILSEGGDISQLNEQQLQQIIAGGQSSHNSDHGTGHRDQIR